MESGTGNSSRIEEEMKAIEKKHGKPVAQLREERGKRVKDVPRPDMSHHM